MEQYGDTLFTRDDRERRRLRLLGEIFDPLTEETLLALGIRPGTRCLEVGAGSGSVARWLCSVAAPAEVVATDIEAAVLDIGGGEANLLPLVHDVTRDDFPPASFDLVHARFVLNHLPDRDTVLRRLTRWLRPGGLLVVESFSWFPVDSSPTRVYRRTMQEWSALVQRVIGTNSRSARNYPGALAPFGLRDLGARTVVQHLQGGTPLADFWRSTVEMSKELLLADSYLTHSQYEQFVERMGDPEFWDMAPAVTQAWGRA